MRKSNILILLFILLSSSCMSKQRDFSYLKIQTVLSQKDQAYYENIHNQISEIGKHFFRGDFDLREKNCRRLGLMIKEISGKPYSRERERERERERLTF